MPLRKIASALLVAPTVLLSGCGSEWFSGPPCTMLQIAEFVLEEGNCDNVETIDALVLWLAEHPGLRVAAVWQPHPGVVARFFLEPVPGAP